MSTTFDLSLLDILVCPVTGNRLDYDAEKALLVSREAGLAWPVKNGIPSLLKEDALEVGQS